LRFTRATSRIWAATPTPRSTSANARPSSAAASAFPTEFDAVTSSFGAMFAPDHGAVADELVRVGRPGGTIGMVNFTPEGLAGDLFRLFARYASPPPPPALPPVMWGSEEHVRELFGDRVASLEMTRAEYMERAASPRDYCELFNRTFGPAVGLRASLADRPERAAAFHSDFLEFATPANRGRSDGPAEYLYQYLLVVAASVWRPTLALCADLTEALARDRRRAEVEPLVGNIAIRTIKEAGELPLPTP
jgi:hypothetical protein